MDISINRFKRGTLLTVSGRLDHTTVGDFSNTLESEINEGIKNIAIEMADVEYMNSASIRAMIAALKDVKKRGGIICIAAPSERVQEVLGIAGMLSMFEIYEDATAAVGNF